MIHVRDHGEGPCVLLLHAFPCDGRLWDAHAQDIADAGFHVLVPDLPGFGSSPMIEEQPSLRSVAEVLLLHLDQAGVERVQIVGCSLGGYVLMQMLAIRPEVASALVLCDTKATADGPEAQANRKRLATLVEASPDDCARILEQAVLPGLLGETTKTSRPEVVDLVRGWMEFVRPEAVAWYQRAMAIRPDSRQVLAAAGVPSLVLWGEEDQLSSAQEQELMVASLQDVNFRVVPDSGHLPMVESPEVTADALVGFVRSIKGQLPS